MHASLEIVFLRLAKYNTNLRIRERFHIAINVEKLHFIHKLTASDTSKTGKNHKKVTLPTSTSPKWQCAAE